MPTIDYSRLSYVWCEVCFWLFILELTESSRATWSMSLLKLVWWVDRLQLTLVALSSGTSVYRKWMNESKEPFIFHLFVPLFLHQKLVIRYRYFWHITAVTFIYANINIQSALSFDATCVQCNMHVNSRTSVELQYRVKLPLLDTFLLIIFKN